MEDALDRASCGTAAGEVPASGVDELGVAADIAAQLMGQKRGY